MIFTNFCFHRVHDPLNVYFCQTGNKAVFAPSNMHSYATLPPSGAAIWCRHLLVPSGELARQWRLELRYAAITSVSLIISSPKCATV